MQRLMGGALCWWAERRPDEGVEPPLAMAMPPPYSYPADRHPPEVFML
jgi:hypothetical protein